MLCFETIYVDHIGRSDIRYSPSTLGQSLEAVGFNKSMILSYQNVPMKICSPFWIHFIDSMYQFFPLSRITFDFHSFAAFTPPSIFIPASSVLTMKTVSFSIKNIQNDSSIVITEVTTSSRDLFVHAIPTIELQPGASISISAMICPTEPKTFSALILISTSRGVLPYSITCRTIKPPKDSDMSPILYQATPFHINISVRLPSQLLGKPISVTYDSTLFDSEKSSIVGRYLHFSPITFKPGLYVTFINIASQTYARVFPLFILVSQKFLQSSNPIIFVETVTTPDGASEAEIKISNPTSLAFRIVQVTMSKDAPSNVKVELSQQPIVCQKFSQTVIGKAIISGFKVGAVDTSVTISFNASNQTFKSFDVPIKGLVIYGSLIPSETKINLLQNARKIHKIHFKSTFEDPVAFLAARTDSALFRVVDFSPFLVPSGGVSPDIIIKFTYQAALASFETALTVETNITKIVIPIHGYNGQVAISDELGKPEFHTTIVKSFGKALCLSMISFSIYITNPNPMGFFVTTVNSTPGISVISVFVDKQKGSEFQVSPFSSSKVTLTIKFGKVDIKPRNDTITFSGPDSSVFVQVSWSPIPGDLMLSSGLPVTLTVGNSYSADVFALSTYQQTLKPKNVTSKISFSPTIQPIIQGSKIKVGNISFILDSNFLKESWPNQINLPFTFTMKSGAILPSALNIGAEYATFQTIEKDLGSVLVFDSLSPTVQFRNFLDTPLILKYGNKSSIVPQSSEVPLQFSISFGAPGKRHVTFAVTTNATPPFYVVFHAAVFSPDLFFTDIEGNQIESLAFSDQNDESYANVEWQREILIQNGGNISVPLNGSLKVDFGCPFISLKVAEKGVLSPGESVELYLALLIWKINDHRPQAQISYRGHGVAISLPITIDMSEKCLKKLIWGRRIGLGCAILIGIFLPAFFAASNLRELIDARRIVAMKDRTRDEEIKKLSKGRKSVATEYIGEDDSKLPGYWNRSGEIGSRVSPRGAESMRTELLNIK